MRSAVVQRSEQRHSGPHVLSDENRDVHLKVKSVLTLSSSTALLPIDDPFKIDDDDLIFRHLIAKKWVVKDTVASLEEYVAWRTSANVNSIFDTIVSAAVRKQTNGYFGRDREGYPIYYDRPNPTEILALLSSETRDVLVKWHIMVAERGRCLAKRYGVDRMTCVLDLKHITMGVLSTPSVMKLMKEFSSIDQHKYPENMRVLCIINAPSSFKWIWKAVKGFLDERVQKKMRVCDRMEVLFEVVEPTCVPIEFGGEGKGFTIFGDELEEFRVALNSGTAWGARDAPTESDELSKSVRKVSSRLSVGPSAHDRGGGNIERAIPDDGEGRAMRTLPTTPIPAAAHASQAPEPLPDYGSAEVEPVIIVITGADPVSNEDSMMTSRADCVDPLMVGASPPTASSCASPLSFETMKNATQLAEQSYPASPQLTGGAPKSPVHTPSKPADASMQRRTDSLALEDSSASMGTVSPPAPSRPSHNDSFSDEPLQRTVTSLPLMQRSTGGLLAPLPAAGAATSKRDKQQQPLVSRVSVSRQSSSPSLSSSAPPSFTPTSMWTAEDEKAVLNSAQVVRRRAAVKLPAPGAVPEPIGVRVLINIASGRPGPQVQLSPRRKFESGSETSTNSGFHSTPQSSPFPSLRAEFEWTSAGIIVDEDGTTMTIREVPSRRHLALVSTQAVVALFLLSPEQCSRWGIEPNTGTAVVVCELDPCVVKSDSAAERNPTVLFAMPDADAISWLMALVDLRILPRDVVAVSSPMSPSPRCHAQVAVQPTSVVNLPAILIIPNDDRDDDAWW